MRLPYYGGWVLLLAAFISAAAEVLVKSTRDSNHMIVAAHDLLYTVWPSGLLILQIRLENIAPYLWDPCALAILTLPAWALLGGPGFICITLFRPRRPDYDKRLEEARQQEQQLLLYDELAREAKTLGVNEENDDMRPDHSAHEIFLKASENIIDDQDEFTKFARDVDFEMKQDTSLLMPRSKK